VAHSSSRELPSAEPHHPATLTADIEQAPGTERERAPTYTVLLYGREGVVVRDLTQGDVLVLGRTSPSELQLEEPSLSRRHARLSWSEDGVVVEDLGSKNGTRVGGRRVSKATVPPGGEVTFGGVIASVRASRGGELRGFDSHDRFMARIHDEWVRARAFRRPLSVILVRAGDRDGGHVSRWAARVQAELRPVDAIAVYASSAVIVMLPELPLAQAVQSASALARPVDGEPALLAGVSSFPDSATTAEWLIEAARRASRQATIESRVAAAEGPSGLATPVRPVVCNPRMLDVYRLAQRAALGAGTVLILGETGTGKELVARTVHACGARRGGPLRALNCAAIPQTLVESVLFGREKGAYTGADRREKGVFEEAHGGTLFLDEIGDLPPPAQAALLRVLETKRLARVGSPREIDVDVRVVAATHRDLEAMVAARAFRQDLLHRLNMLTLEIPPLRERPDEIDRLAHAFFEAALRDWPTGATRFAPKTLAILRTYAWPGNVRELRNVVERAVMIASGEEIAPDDLPERVRGAVASAEETEDEESESFATEVRNHEIRLIERALAKTGGNQKEAAKVLSMPLRTLVHKIRVYGLRKKEP